jgi:hypothetical protein
MPITPNCKILSHHLPIAMGDTAGTMLRPRIRKSFLHKLNHRLESLKLRCLLAAAAAAAASREKLAWRLKVDLTRQATLGSGLDFLQNRSFHNSCFRA